MTSYELFVLDKQVRQNILDIAKLEEACAMAYQAIGVLSECAGLAEHRSTGEVLDCLSAAQTGKQFQIPEYPGKPFPEKYKSNAELWRLVKTLDNRIKAQDKEYGERIEVLRKEILRLKMEATARKAESDAAVESLEKDLATQRLKHSEYKEQIYKNLYGGTGWRYMSYDEVVEKWRSSQ